MLQLNLQNRNRPTDIENKLWLPKGKGSESEVTQSCLTFCDPMNCSTPGLPVHHQLPEFTQTQCMCKVKSEVAHSLRPVDCSPPSSSVHGILQGRILEWVAISFSRGSSRPRDRTQVSHIAGRCFNLCTTREAKPPIETQNFRCKY